MKVSDKWISYLLLATLLCEAVAQYTNAVFRNDMYVYHVYGPIELFLICMYFSERISFLKRYKVGLAVGVIGVALAIMNAVFWQPPYSINSIFLMYEGFSVIALCLYSFYRLMVEEEEIFKNVHFWFTAILLLYWSFVFFYWGMYAYFLTSLRAYLGTVSIIFQFVNILTYSGFAIVFLRYRKLVSLSE